MVKENEFICPSCGGLMEHYDTVKRVIRVEYGKKKHIYVDRAVCRSCNHFHRQIPSIIFPYKQYRRDIIEGVLSGKITGRELRYEDYPCELTTRRWISQSLHLLY